MRFLPIGLLLSLLAGCGFQLAGKQPLPEYLTSISMQADDRHSDVYEALKRGFAARDVAVLSEAPNQLVLHRVESGQRVLSVSARNIPREYEVYYSVSYTLLKDGKNVLARDGLTMTRNYTWDETQVLGKAREEALLREAIVEEIVAVIMRQIASL